MQEIDYVIGMRDTILDDAAIAFTTGFYDGLGYGRNIEDAFKLGQNAILWELASFTDRTRQLIPVDFEKVESQESLPEHLKPILLKKAENVVQNLKNQPIKNDYVAISQNPIQKYRERIKEYLAARILTPIAKFQLANLAKELGISESEANKILQAELQEIEQAKENYQNLLRQTIEQGHYPFNSQVQQQLKNLQTDLKLTETEVAEISRPILAQAEIQIRIQKFTFQVITVDERGEEVKRESGQAQYFKEELGNGITLDLVYIPGGSFMMGSPEGEGIDSEKPQHEVKVSSFFMGKFQVTQAQWRAVALLPKINQDLNPDPDPFIFKGDDLPVERVSWVDAREFCARLSKQTGKKYRLPSEAEWEYAARAGTTTPFHFGETITGKLANYRASQIYANEAKGEYRGKTTPVGSFPPNFYGLYDMHGNAWEWCEDNWHDNYKNAPNDGSAWISGTSSIEVVRGGSCNDYPFDCRSAYRGILNPHYRSNIGLRVACGVPGTL